MDIGTNERRELAMRWHRVCALDAIVPNAGVCALIDGEHVAVFHIKTDGDDGSARRVFAIGNIDPMSNTSILSRGMTGSVGERIVVASPMYKHHFDLSTGECIESPDVAVRLFAARIEDEHVWVASHEHCA